MDSRTLIIAMLLIVYTVSAQYMGGAPYYGGYGFGRNGGMYNRYMGGYGGGYGMSPYNNRWWNFFSDILDYFNK